MTCQSSFGAALLDPEAPPPPGLTDAQGRPAGRRFDVYRNNVAASLGDALATGFPVISKLLGEEFFRAMAGVFLRAHPPGDPRLQLWGAKFPGFLARFDPVAHLPYLPDMARLELGLRQSYHAADATPLPIAGRDPAEVLALRPRLAPATLILRSRFPVLTIWQKNTGRPDLRIDLAAARRADRPEGLRSRVAPSPQRRAHARPSPEGSPDAGRGCDGDAGDRPRCRCLRDPHPHPVVGRIDARSPPIRRTLTDARPCLPP
jgi:hypothetical protein